MQRSSIWLKASATGAEIHFSGITQVRHSLSLKVATDTDSSEIVDYLNGARTQPAKVVLSLVETDVGHPKGYAARILEILDVLRSTKVLVEIFTPIRNYMNMVLSDLVAIQEDGNVDGWTGTATFTEVLGDESGGRMVNNSSTISNTGSTVKGTVNAIVDADGTIHDSPLRELLERSGIALG